MRWTSAVTVTAWAAAAVVLAGCGEQAVDDDGRTSAAAAAPSGSPFVDPDTGLELVLYQPDEIDPKSMTRISSLFSKRGEVDGDEKFTRYSEWVQAAIERVGGFSGSSWGFAPNPDGHLSVVVGTRADEAAAVRLMDDLGVPIEVEFTPGDTLENLAPSVGATPGPP